MKLIDMLVDAGLNGWKWPDGTIAITQDKDKAINQYATADGLETNEHGTWKYSASWQTYLRLSHEELCLASDWATAIITREQYEAALAAKNDGWIEWGGGECPVNASEMVDVMFGCGGRVSTNIADCWRWNHNGTDSDIIAYRLHKPQKAEQAKADEEADPNECIVQDAAPVWSGGGLPPVGCECKVDYGSVELIDGLSRPDDGDVVRVVSHEKTGFGTQVVVVYWNGVNGGGRAHALIPKCLRPLRTEAERKREAAIKELTSVICGETPDTGMATAAMYAARVYDAGYRKDGK